MLSLVSPKRIRSPGSSFLAGRDQSAPAAGVDALDQRRFDLRDRLAAHADSAEPRRDHFGVVDHQRVAGAKEIRQVGDAMVGERAVGVEDQQARRVARRGGRQRDALRRQVEVELVDAHDVRTRPVAPPADTRDRAPPQLKARLHDLVGVGHRLAALDLVDIVHAGDDLAPGGVFPVEERCVVEADEKLRIGRIRALGARHRHGAAHMRLGVELGLDVGIFRAAGPRAVRAAGLRHEAFDHPVEHDPVVKTLGHQALDMGDMAGGEIGPHFDDDRSLGRLERQNVALFSHRSRAPVVQ